MSIEVLVLALFVTACSGSEIASERAVKKLEVLKSIDQINGKLVDLADLCSKRECESEGALDETLIVQRVDRVVDSTSDPDVLFRLAITSYVSAFPQTAGVQRVDLVFDTAWTASIKRLSDLGTPQALSALKTLESLLKTDAGDALTLRNAIERAAHPSKS
jgi:hypothetical protein